MWFVLCLLCAALVLLLVPSARAYLTNHSSAFYELDNYGECPRGSYQKTTSASLKKDCELCQRGKYADDSGLSSCESCPKGTYNPRQGSKTIDDCMSCPAGSYSTTTAASKCTECAVGKYSKAVGASAATTCVTCPSDYFYDTCRAGLPYK